MDSLLIDADITLYRAASACEREVRWDDHNHVLVSNVEEVWSAVESQIEYYRRELGNGPMHFALSGGDNFRRKLWDGYKGGRSRKPLCYSAIRDRLTETYGARSVPTLEADDLLGIWATQGKITNPIIVSLDKDLRTIPGRIWRPANGTTEAKMYEVTEDQADYWWMTQTLTGDVTDGYKGLPGCGPKVAEKILHEALDGLGSMQIGPRTLPYMWGQVVQAYQAKGLGSDDALLQARLSRILRASDWESEKQEVRLWTPNSK